jgi:hypothetical protein
MQYVNVIVCSNSIDYFCTKHIASSCSIGTSFEIQFPNYLRGLPNCGSIIFLGMRLEMEGEWCGQKYKVAEILKSFLTNFFFSKKTISISLFYQLPCG